MTDETYKMSSIPPQMVDGIWHFAEPYIKRALEHTFGELSHLDILALCKSGDMQLWMMVKGKRVVGAGTTSLVIYPQMKVCRIVTMAGSEFDEWRDYAHANIEVWAKMQEKCQAIEAYVRKGFVPKLLAIGFKHRYSVVHKSLE